MRALVLLTAVFSLLLAGSEIARWWGDPRFIPLALDEIILAFLLGGAALGVRRNGLMPLALSWAAFSGFILCLLVPALDHLVFGPPKPGALFYSIILGLMLLLGLGFLWWTMLYLRRARR